MTWLLNLLYAGLLLAVSPVLLWRALRHGKYRSGWSEKLWGRVPRRTGRDERFWLHAVSVGEVNLLPPVVAALRERFPDAEIVVSTTTATGMDVARRHFGASSVFYCPLDFSWAVRAALARVRPTVLLLAELELWPNLIRIADRSGVAVGVINARLSESSFRGYHRARWLISPLLRRLTFVAAQDQETLTRFRALGVPTTSLTVTGSIKFDGAPSDRGAAEVCERRRWSGLEPEHVLWMAGSTLEPEEQYVLAAYARLAERYPQLRLAIVPRHPERFDEVARRIDQQGDAVRRRSSGGPGHADWPSGTVLLCDSVGELRHWWGTAEIAFVGGSMSRRGGQNMLEPAGYGAAVCFGPDTRNFRDISRRLIAADAATVVEDAEALAAFVARCLEQPEWAKARGDRARQLVRDGRGAIRRTVEEIAHRRTAGPHRRAA